MKKLFQSLGLLLVSFAMLIGCGEEATAPDNAVITW